MQKQVSKQSLAVIALSILLAISMALTATFAAFSSANTVTGSITFENPNIALVLVGNTEATQVSQGQNGAITFTLSANDFVLIPGETDQITLNSTATAAIQSIGYYIVAADAQENAFNLGSAANYKVEVSFDGDDSFAGLITIANAANKTGQTEAVGTAQAPIQLFTVNTIDADDINVTDAVVNVVATLVRANNA